MSETPADWPKGRNKQIKYMWNVAERIIQEVWHEMPEDTIGNILYTGRDNTDDEQEDLEEEMESESTWEYCSCKERKLEKK